MRPVKTTLVAALVATTALSTAVYAAEQSHQQPKTTEQTSPQQKVADQDFSKLSKDGFKAMQDVREARLAIFNGMPDKARKDVTNSMQALESAKTDNTSFMKAEADLKQPGDMTNAQAKPGDAKAPNTSASTTPVMWLPINGSISVAEDFTTSPQKTAGVKKANEQLKAGQRKEALETLKVNDVNVAVTIEAAPLNATIAGIDQASKLIDTGKYYEANKALMNVENGIRFYVVDASGAPVKTMASDTHNDKATTTTGSTASAQKPADTATPAPATGGMTSGTAATGTNK